MNVVFLSWYTSGVLLVGALFLSFVTVVPESEGMFNSLGVGFVVGAASAATVAVILRRKPASHWVNTSTSFFTLFVAIATACTLVVALIG